MRGGGKKDDDSEPLKLTCCGKRSLVLVGQGGDCLEMNTGREGSERMGLSRNEKRQG